MAVNIPGVGSFTLSGIDAELNAALNLQRQISQNIQGALDSFNQGLFGMMQLRQQQERLGLEKNKLDLESGLEREKTDLSKRRLAIEEEELGLFRGREAREAASFAQQGDIQARRDSLAAALNARFEESIAGNLGNLGGPPSREQFTEAQRRAQIDVLSSLKPEESMLIFGGNAPLAGAIQSITDVESAEALSKARLKEEGVEDVSGLVSSFDALAKARGLDEDKAKIGRGILEAMGAKKIDETAMGNIIGELEKIPSKEEKEFEGKARSRADIIADRQIQKPIIDDAIAVHDALKTLPADSIAGLDQTKRLIESPGKVVASKDDFFNVLRDLDRVIDQTVEKTGMAAIDDESRAIVKQQYLERSLNTVIGPLVVVDTNGNPVRKKTQKEIDEDEARTAIPGVPRIAPPGQSQELTPRQFAELVEFMTKAKLRIK